MKRFYTFLIIALMGSAANAQGWLPWDHNVNFAPNGQAVDYDVKALAEGNTLTIAYSSSSSQTVEVQQFNGISWTPLPIPFTSPTSDTARELLRYQGDLMLLTETRLLRFDGQSWTLLDDNNGQEAFTDMEVYNGEVLYGSVGGPQGQLSLYVYDGTGSGSFPGAPSSIDSVADIHVYNNELYVAGGVGSWPGIRGLIKYDGSIWTSPAQHLASTITYFSYSGQAVFDLNGRLYWADHRNLSEIRNDSVIPMAKWSVQPLRWQSEVEVYNDTAYFGARFPIQSGRALFFDGQGVDTLQDSPIAITDVARYQGQNLLFTPPAQLSQASLKAMIWAKNSSAAILSTDIYFDINSNCGMDAADTLLNQHFISLENGQYVFAPNRLHNSIILPAGTYNIDSVFGFTSWNQHLTPSCNWPTSVTLAAGQGDTLTLALSLANVDDAEVQISPYRGWSARYGFTETFEVVVRNLGGNTLSNFDVDLNYNSGLGLILAAPTPSSTSAGKITWTVNQLPPLQEDRFLMELRVDTSNFSIGDTIWFDSQVSLANDVESSNNQDTLWQEITGAIDPNDKQASAERIYTGTKKVDYHIRFQNTGNDTAYKVTVVDTLDMSLPITRIIINSASHPYSLSVKDNILVWEFDNIMLPDSATDFYGSQGFVRFSAGLNPSLGVGDTIDNDAEIYFDYQPAVHTNHAKTVIVDKVSLPEQWIKEELKIEVFPNPAIDKIFLRNKATVSVHLRLFDQTGKALDEFSLEPDEKLVYPIGHLPAGVYLLKSDKQAFRVIIR